jgi:uncharacterized protein (TIGR00297 family)
MQDIIFGAVLLVTAFFSYQKRKLTLTATLMACVVAICIYCGTRWIGIALLGTFFLIGIAVTSANKKQKQHSGYSADENGRDAKQVLANGSLAAIVAIIALIFPEQQEIFLLMMACIFSSATADTVSSELGFVYGRNCYNILTLKKDTRGENGVISIEGTLSGLAGSIFIAFIYSLTIEQFQVCSVLTIILAGTIGNIADSVLGATLERNHLIGNNAVNFLNTLIAALIGGLIA